MAVDGNFLFYNSPVVTSDGVNEYVVYLTSDGKVVIKKNIIINLSNFFNKSATEEYVVHDYNSVINYNRGSADDHAAPSVIYDDVNDRIVIATAYHGSPLYIYQFKEGKFKKIKKINGRYTYPRLFKSRGVVNLLARLQPEGIKGGDFVFRTSSDNFTSEETVVKSSDGHVVYASAPAILDDKVYFQYSMHSYAENRLIGWNVLRWNILTNKINSCDLSSLLPAEYESNRPTGINVNLKNIIITTSFFDKKNHKKIADNFNRNNVVYIVKMDTIDMENGKCGTDIIHKGTAKAPYYHTSVAVSDNLDWIYFNNNKYVSNNRYMNCFNHEGMMYPNFYKDNIYFATQNLKYSIRSFKNSIFGCKKL